MKERILTGLALSSMMLVVLIVGGWLFFGVITLGVGYGLWEYYKLIQIKRAKPLVGLGIAIGLMFVSLAYAGRWWPHVTVGAGNIGSVVVLYVMLVLVIQFWQIVQRKERYSITDLGVTIFGSLYIGAFGSFLVLLLNYGEYHFSDDLFKARLVVFMPMWGAWGNDVGAFFIGKFFGKNRIFPELSPKKTLEGCLGGMAVSTLGFGIMSAILGIPIFQGMVLGGLTGMFGQIGDLSESALKREVGIKDSGTIFGSHGGLLDRIDSILFTAPIVYHYFAWFHPWG